MGANDQKRRLEAVQKIDEKVNEYREKFNSRVAASMLPDIIEEVSEEVFYSSSTLQKYYNDWVQKKGFFANDKH